MGWELGAGSGWHALTMGLLDGQGLFHTHLGLRLGGKLLAGQTRKTRQQAAEGLGLRLVSGWHTLRPVSDCAKAVRRCSGPGQPRLSCLGSRTEGLRR